MRNLPLFPLVMAMVFTVSGCASDGGSSHYSSGDYIGPVYPSSGMYYGARDYYYYDDYPDYIVTPRPPVDVPDRPDHRPGLHPEHPIANPPGTRPNRPSTLPANRPAYRSTTPSMSHQRARAPSIPSHARPSGGMRGGSMRGGRGGGGRRR